MFKYVVENVYLILFLSENDSKTLKTKKNKFRFMSVDNEIYTIIYNEIYHIDIKTVCTF